MNSELHAMVEFLAMLLSEPRSGSLIGLLGIAACLDCLTRRIPNVLVFGGALLGLVLSVLLPTADGASLADSLAGMAAGFAIMLPFYLLRTMGAADVKLMTMTGSFLGLSATIYAVAAVLIAGGFLALGYALYRGALRHMLRNVQSLLQGAMLSVAAGERPQLSLGAKEASVGSLPYGLAIAGGTIAFVVLRQLGLL